MFNIKLFFVAATCKKVKNYAQFDQAIVYIDNGPLTPEKADVFFTKHA